MDPWLDLECLSLLRELVHSPGGLTRDQLVRRVGSYTAARVTPRLEGLGHIKRQGGRWHAGNPLPAPRDALNPVRTP